MQTLYLAIDSLADFLRSHVKRGTWLWNRLKGARDASALIHQTVNKRRWAANYQRFNNLIDQYSRETDDFFVLQIGACDGVLDDPIRQWIQKYKWQGVLVEPQKEMFERLKLNYAGSDKLSFENVAIAEKDCVRPLYKLKHNNIEADWQEGLASLLSERLLGENIVTTEMVQCITFRTLFDRQRIGHIDFLQIDVEGYDSELIKMFDFLAIKPRLIRYEHRHLKFSDRLFCKNHLVANGYAILEMKHDTGAVLHRNKRH